MGRQLFLFSKTIHRVCMIAMLVIGGIMGVTGSVLKFTKIAAILSKNPVEMLEFVRKIHNITSPFFSIVFGLMALTGLVMYFFPILQQKKIAQ